EGFAREGGSLLVGKMRVGQSGSVHVHDTLLNALSGALLIRLVGTNRIPPARSCLFWKESGVVGQAQSRELPAVVWIEEVAIGHAAVAFRGCKRGSSQHQLVDHELAVVFPERALDGTVAGIGRICAAGPLPDDPEGVIEFVGARGDFP